MKSWCCISLLCVTRSAGSQEMAFRSLNYRTKKPQLHVNNTKGMKGEENNNQNKNASFRIRGHILSSVFFSCELSKYYTSSSWSLSLSQWWMCIFALHIEPKSTIRATSDHSRRVSMPCGNRRTWNCPAVIGSSVTRVDTRAEQPHN